MLHQGACSDTMETDGRYMMENNYRYSKRLLDWCQDEEVPLIYASSAAVYGAGPEFREERRCEREAFHFFTSWTVRCKPSAVGGLRIWTRDSAR